MYPYVQAYKRYPFGHPKVINTGFDTTPYKYFGIIRAKVLAPQDLYIPILPMRSKKKKLIFALCR